MPLIFLLTWSGVLSIFVTIWGRVKEVWFPTTLMQWLRSVLLHIDRNPSIRHAFGFRSINLTTWNQFTISHPHTPRYVVHNKEIWSHKYSLTWLLCLMPEWLCRLIQCDSFDRATCRCCDNYGFVLFPFELEKIDKPMHTPKKWAYMGRNSTDRCLLWQSTAGKWAGHCKVDKFVCKKWWQKQKKVCIDCIAVSTFVSQEIFV